MAAPTTVAATTKVEVAAATGTGNRERRTKVGSVASPTPVEIRPARKAPIPEENDLLPHAFDAVLQDFTVGSFDFSPSF